MARLLSRILELDELVLPSPPPEPPAPPPSEPPAWLAKLRQVPFLWWLVALSLGLRFNVPITIFLMVAVSVWKLLSPHIVIVAGPLRRVQWQHNRRRGWDAIRPDLLFDEAGRIGLIGEIATLKRLTSLPDDYVVLHDVRVPTDFGTTQLDLVVLGPGGVWCLEVKAWAGRVYGEESERQWTQVKYYGTKSYKDLRDNPIRQNAYHCEALQTYLGKLGYDPRVQSLVVMTRADVMKRTDSLVVSLPELNGWVTLPHGEPLDPSQINDMAQALRPLLGDPERQVYSTASAQVRHDVLMQRVRPVRSEVQVDEAQQPATAPLAGLLRFALKLSVFAVVVCVMTALMHCVLNGVFASLGGGHQKGPIVPLSASLLISVVMGVNLMWPAVSRKRRRSR